MPSPNLTKGAARHPEKRRNEDKPQPRRPDWLRVKAPRAGAFSETKRLMRDLDLVTVCHISNMYLGILISQDLH